MLETAFRHWLAAAEIEGADMSDASIKLEIVGTLDPDGTLFAKCMDRAFDFKTDDWSLYASRVETLWEIYDNNSRQRVTEYEPVEGES